MPSSIELLKVDLAIIVAKIQLFTISVSNWVSDMIFW